MNSDTRITAARLYDLIQCPHRPSMDLFGNPEERDQVSPFVQLLWERGTAHELDVIGELSTPFLDLSGYSGKEKEAKTLEAMRQGEPLIYAGRITADNLVGEPDLLRREGDGYVAGDIKSGAGEEHSSTDSKPKKHYGVQLALYTDILERLGSAGSRVPFVWDVHGDEIPYDLDESHGSKSPWTMAEVYAETLRALSRIIDQTEVTTAAYSSMCKQCHWRSACSSQLEAANDLTLIPELGRARRDAMEEQLPSVIDLAAANVADYLDKKKTVFPGVGAAMLDKFHERARLAVDPDSEPYLTADVALPNANRELFFDIEVDPMRNVCYLHGFVERTNGDAGSEQYVSFFADDLTAAAEEKAFAAAWDYIQTSKPCSIYYYSKYERTIWRKLQEKYPHVCTRSDIDALFEDPLAVDLLYDVVKKATEWPTRDYSIKTLAGYLGFEWRDTEPSGAASIEWYDRWVKSGDEGIKQRILEYNEDDCIATRVLLDAVRALPLKPTS